MRDRFHLLLLAALIAGGCGGKKGTLTVNFVTPLDVDPFAAAANVRVIVGNPAVADQTFPVSQGHFSGDVSFKPPSEGTLVGPVVVEVLDAGGAVISRGRTPDLPFRTLDESVSVWVAPVERVSVFRGGLAKPRTGFAAARLPGLGALFAGGTISDADGGPANTEVTDVEVFSGYTLSVIGVQALPRARAGALAIPVDKSGDVGNVLLAGGRLDLEGHDLDLSLLAFDASYASGPTGTWTPLGNYARLARAGAASTQLSDGTTLVVGGSGPSGNLDTAVIVTTAGSIGDSPVAGTLASARGQLTVTPAKVPSGEGAIVIGGGSAELYATASRTFAPSPIDGKLLPSGLHTASPLPSGKVLVLGGVNAFMAATSGDGLLIDAVAGTAKPLPQLLSTPRARHTATPLGATLLVCGGYDDMPRTIASCDLLDVSGDEPKRVKTMPLATPRARHAAVVLPQGIVLLAGGNDDLGPLGSLEIYTP